MAMSMDLWLILLTLNLSWVARKRATTQASFSLLARKTRRNFGVSFSQLRIQLFGIPAWGSSASINSLIPAADSTLTAKTFILSLRPRREITTQASRLFTH